MHRSETRELAACAECGAEIVAERDRGYQFGTGAALCFACAVRRGGSYDERRDRWTTPPDVSGLATPED
jgi:hypothetical protein